MLIILWLVYHLNQTMSFLFQFFRSILVKNKKISSKYLYWNVVFISDDVMIYFTELCSNIWQIVNNLVWNIMIFHSDFSFRCQNVFLFENVLRINEIFWISSTVCVYKILIIMFHCRKKLYFTALDRKQTRNMIFVLLN